MKDTITKPQLPRHQHHHKFLHLGVRIGILLNIFQMEPTTATTPEAEHLEAVGMISRMMLLGLYEHIYELIEGYPYEVVVVD